MEWINLTVRSWSHFVEETTRILGDNNAFTPAYIWRGQSNATWRLHSSLSRILPPDVTFARAIHIEDELLKMFQLRAHVYLRSSDLPDKGDLFSWWGHGSGGTRDPLRRLPGRPDQAAGAKYLDGNRCAAGYLQG